MNRENHHSETVRGMPAFFFDLAFFVFALVSLPSFMLRLKGEKGGRRLFRERAALFSPEEQRALEKRRPVWIHAVSVGEVLAVRPFLKNLLEKYPDVSVLLTAVTPTGLEMAQKCKSGRVSVRYFPFDFSFVMRRFLKAVNPRLILLAETEIWPNLIIAASEQGVPVGVINGRLSKKSAARYGLISGVMKPVFGELDFVLAQTAGDVKRFAAAGVPPARVFEAGNLKFDGVSMEGWNPEAAQKLRSQWRFNREDIVWVCGSTHEGDERVIAEVFAEVRRLFPDLKLLLVPRHVHRAETVCSFFQKQGYHVKYAVQGAPTSLQADVFVLNQLGVLKSLYAVADIVFVGGSFMRRGGQSPIEPAALKRAMLHGPTVHNFEMIYEKLDREGGAVRVENAGQLKDQMMRLLQDGAARKEMGERAYQAVLRLQGATRRHLDYLQQLWRESYPAPAEVEESMTGLPDTGRR